jgi:hypothetical protein
MPIGSSLRPAPRRRGASTALFAAALALVAWAATSAAGAQAPVEAGEMNAEQLKVTTLDPRKRRTLRVVIEHELETDRVLNDLMGRDASMRFKYIMEHAPRADAEALDV